jgi:hypothetical protein
MRVEVREGQSDRLALRHRATACRAGVFVAHPASPSLEYSRESPAAGDPAVHLPEQRLPV